MTRQDRGQLFRTGLVAALGNTDQEMLPDLADIAPIERSGCCNRFKIGPELSERRSDGAYFAGTRRRTRSGRDRHARGHHGRVLDKGAVRMALVCRQHDQFQSTGAERPAVRRVLLEGEVQVRPAERCGRRQALRIAAARGTYDGS